MIKYITTEMYNCFIIIVSYVHVILSVLYKHYASIPFQIEKILNTKTMNPGLEESVPTSDEVEALRAGQELMEKRVYLRVGKTHLVMLTIYSS